MDELAFIAEGVSIGEGTPTEDVALEKGEDESFPAPICGRAVPFRARGTTAVWFVIQLYAFGSSFCSVVALTDA